MQDRVPTPGQEGRVLITPENGGTPFYATISMADNPSVEGTPWAVLSVLQDATAALFGLGTDAVPDNVFEILSQAALYKTVTPSAQIGTLPVGKIIYLNENGSPVPYIIVNQGIPQNSPLYDSSCDGTWVLRQDIYENAVWDAGNSNVLPGADIFTTMAGMLSLYDSDVQSAIQTVKIPYCVGGVSATVNGGANGLQCQIFPLSGYEVGWTNSDDSSLPEDGAVLSFFEGTDRTDAKRLAYLNGQSQFWWLRTPQIGSPNTAWLIFTGGVLNVGYANDSCGLRPAFVLPKDFTAVLAPSPVNGLYNVSDNLLLKLPGVQIETGSYTGTGTYGSSNPNTLTFGFEPKAVFIAQNLNVGSTSYPEYFINFIANGVETGSGNGNTSISIAGNTISWYNDNGANQQLNRETSEYCYLAIG